MSTIQKYRFIARSLLRPLHANTTGDATVKTSTVTRLRLRPLDTLSLVQCPLAKAAERPGDIVHIPYPDTTNFV